MLFVICILLKLDIWKMENKLKMKKKLHNNLFILSAYIATLLWRVRHEFMLILKVGDLIEIQKLFPQKLLSLRKCHIFPKRIGWHAKIIKTFIKPFPKICSILLSLKIPYVKGSYFIITITTNSILKEY